MTSSTLSSTEFDVEQYGALRAEVLRAMEDGNSIMSFGLAGIGLVLNAGISARDALLGFLILSIVAPGLAILVLSMWFASAERVARASHFLSGIESRLKGDSPSWELWLRATGDRTRKARHFWNTEYSGVAIFLFLVLAPLGLSMTTGGDSVDMWVKALVVAAMTLAVGLFALTLASRARRWRWWLATTYGAPE